MEPKINYYRRNQENLKAKGAIRKFQPWNKQDIETILDTWEKSSIKEVADAVGRGVGSVQYIVGVLRKNGFKLAAKKYFPPSSRNILDALEELRKERIIK